MYTIVGTALPPLVVRGEEEDELEVAARFAREVDEFRPAPRHLVDEGVDRGHLRGVGEVRARDEVVRWVVEALGAEEQHVGAVRAREAGHARVLQDQGLGRIGRIPAPRAGPTVREAGVAALLRLFVVEGQVGARAGVDAGLVVIGDAGQPVDDPRLGAARQPLASRAVGRDAPDVVLVVEQDRAVPVEPAAGAEAVRGDDVGRRVVAGVRELGGQPRRQVMPFAGGDVEAVVRGAVPREQPVAARARPFVAHAGEDLAALAGVRIDGPDVVVRTAEHRPPRVGLVDVLQGVVPAVQELGRAHEIGPEDDDAVIVEVPHGEQRSRGVAVLRDPLLREEADIRGVPDLQAGKVGFGVGGRGILALSIVLALRVVRRSPSLVVVRAVIGLVARFRLDRPEPHGNHAAVVRPGGGAVPDRLEGVGDAGRVRAQDHRLDAAVQAAPREDVVGGAIGGSVVAGAEGGQIRGVVAPAEAPVGGTGRVGRAQHARVGVVHLYAVAHVGAGRDGERQKGSGRAPGHLARVPERDLRFRGQRDDAEVGPLARGFVRRVAAQRQVTAGGVEAPLGDRVERAGFPAPQVHHRGLLADRFVALRQPLPFLRRQDRSSTPASGRRGRTAAPNPTGRRGPSPPRSFARGVPTSRPPG